MFFFHKLFGRHKYRNIIVIYEPTIVWMGVKIRRLKSTYVVKECSICGKRSFVYRLRVPKLCPSWLGAVMTNYVNGFIELDDLISILKKHHCKYEVCE